VEGKHDQNPAGQEQVEEPSPSILCKPKEVKPGNGRKMRGNEEFVARSLIFPLVNSPNFLPTEITEGGKRVEAKQKKQGKSKVLLRGQKGIRPKKSSDVKEKTYPKRRKRQEEVCGPMRDKEMGPR